MIQAIPRKSFRNEPIVFLVSVSKSRQRSRPISQMVSLMSRSSQAFCERRELCLADSSIISYGETQQLLSQYPHFLQRATISALILCLKPSFTLESEEGRDTWGFKASFCWRETTAVNESCLGVCNVLLLTTSVSGAAHTLLNGGGWIKLASYLLWHRVPALALDAPLFVCPTQAT